MKNLNAWLTIGIVSLIIIWVLFGWVASWIIKTAIVVGIIYLVLCVFFGGTKNHPIK